uniref:Uncharacterized protein n=1 Tax=Cacopsylla melanoneura TaxID=428564 RepID=A0A8D8S0J9_9HEMI
MGRYAIGLLSFLSLYFLRVWLSLQYTRSVVSNPVFLQEQATGSLDFFLIECLLYSLFQIKSKHRQNGVTHETCTTCCQINTAEIICAQCSGGFIRMPGKSIRRNYL